MSSNIIPGLTVVELLNTLFTTGNITLLYIVYNNIIHILHVYVERSTFVFSPLSISPFQKRRCLTKLFPRLVRTPREDKLHNTQPDDRTCWLVQTDRTYRREYTSTRSQSRQLFTLCRFWVDIIYIDTYMYMYLEESRKRLFVQFVRTFHYIVAVI